MAVKGTSTIVNQGDQILKYKVGSATLFPAIAGGRCGGPRAGDKLIIKSIAPEDPTTFNIIADTNGLMPVICIYPITDRLIDPNGRGDPNGDDKFNPGNCYGNDDQPDVYRIDPSSVFLRWNCTVQIEGGAASASVDATSTLLISYSWDRAWVMNRNGGRTLTDHPLQDHTLTYYKQGPGGAFPNRLLRPYGAVDVWTPEAQNLSLDFGPVAAAAGTTTTQDWTCNNGRNSAMPWGAYQYVYTRTGGANTAMISRIRL